MIEISVTGKDTRPIIIPILKVYNCIGKSLMITDDTAFDYFAYKTQEECSNEGSVKRYIDTLSVDKEFSVGSSVVVYTQDDYEAALEELGKAPDAYDLLIRNLSGQVVDSSINVFTVNELGENEEEAEFIAMNPKVVPIKVCYSSKGDSKDKAFVKVGASAMSTIMNSIHYGTLLPFKDTVFINTFAEAFYDLLRVKKEVIASLLKEGKDIERTTDKPSDKTFLQRMAREFGINL